MAELNRRDEAKGIQWSAGRFGEDCCGGCGGVYCCEYTGAEGFYVKLDLRADAVSRSPEEVARECAEHVRQSLAARGARGAQSPAQSPEQVRMV